MAFRDNTLFTSRQGSKNKNINPGISSKLMQLAVLEQSTLLAQLQSRLDGLTQAEAETRLEQYGKNIFIKEQRLSFLQRLWENLRNPLVILLAVLDLVSFLTGDIHAGILIGVMLLLGVVLRFVQESRADHAAEKLQAMVSTTCTVLRNGQRVEIDLNQIVPGDVLFLSAGDLVPADARVLNAKDLFINQSALTGEAYPVEKTVAGNGAESLFEVSNLCCLGSNVESGSGTAVVLATGINTYFGSLSNRLTANERPMTSFDRGVNSFTWLMIGFMLVMVPLVFLFNGLSKHNWLEAFLFALAVAVGLTPEMLPMIVTVNLSKGAIAMSKKKVIVKRLNAIQNFGAMDVLCTDKTGTITEGKIVLEKHMDVSGNENDEILDLAFLNSFYQTGLKNMMDLAILERTEQVGRVHAVEDFHKVDEVPFDFHRKRMSVVVEDSGGGRLLITKGAVEEILAVCSKVEVKGEVLERTSEHDAKRKVMIDQLNTEGFRVVALAYKWLHNNTAAEPAMSVKDESEMTLKGFLAFLDPPKESAQAALTALEQHHVAVKILTGDNELVTQTVCRQVGLPVNEILLGNAIEAMNDTQLGEAAEKTTVFAKLAPEHKERIIRVLRERDHVVGFMGDGINDAPALRAADVGISVNTAVDIAKESSDIILLENSLLVLEEGVLEGRRVFGNIVKYIKMAASSNFGNMFSMLGASLILPFLPMLPIQVLVNNLLYDFSQTAIPTDSVDDEWLERPRKWAIGEIRRFILFIGPISSIFDYLTFALMLFVFKSAGNPALFHTGWFVESLFTQTLIIHVIRTNKVPFLQSKPSRALLFTSLAIALVGIVLPYSPLAGVLGLVPLPPIYWAYLAGMMLLYMLLTQVVKTWFFHKFGG
jgi:Mg2+-importing ATPase